MTTTATAPTRTERVDAALARHPFTEAERFAARRAMLAQHGPVLTIAWEGIKYSRNTASGLSLSIIVALQNDDAELFATPTPAQILHALETEGAAQ